MKKQPSSISNSERRFRRAQLDSENNNNSLLFGKNAESVEDGSKNQNLDSDLDPEELELLRFQREFLSNNLEPSAKIIRKNKAPAPSSSSSAPRISKFKQSRQEEDGKIPISAATSTSYRAPEAPSKPEAIVGRIVERNIKNSSSPKPILPTSASRGFPRPLNRSLGQTFDQKKSASSTENNEDQKNEAKMTPDPTLYNPTTSHLIPIKPALNKIAAEKAVEDLFRKKLAEAGLIRDNDPEAADQDEGEENEKDIKPQTAQDREKERQEIDKASSELLKKMSREEIEQERQTLLNTLNPKLVQVLMRRKTPAGSSKENFAPEAERSSVLEHLAQIDPQYKFEIRNKKKKKKKAKQATNQINSTLA